MAIVVKRDVAVAWVAENDSFRSLEYQVHALDKAGSRLLTAGRDIDPHSLAVKGSRLYWTQGGKPASAVLR